VATAIEEHYRPRGADDSIPASLPGIAVALADRLDSLTGLFAAGLAPTGARDPFALRRAAMGVIQILMERDIRFDLREGVRQAATLEPIPVSETVQTQILDSSPGECAASWPKKASALMSWKRCWALMPIIRRRRVARRKN